MSEDEYTVRCEWDPAARGWVATSDDVPGLATGADTLDELIEKLKVVIPELLAANGLLNPDQQGDIPFAIIAQRHETAPRARDGGELHAGGQKVVARGWCRFERQGKGDHENLVQPARQAPFHG